VKWLIIQFLGTSAGTPTRSRGLPSVLVYDGRRYILLDCGEGTQYRLLQVGVSVCRIDIVLITHLHGDHVFGLPGLISSMALLGRVKNLKIFGPVGLLDMLESCIKFLNTLPFKVEIFEIEDFNDTNPKIILAEDDLEISCIKTMHSTTNFAYRLRWYIPLGKFKPEVAKKLNIPTRYWKLLHTGHVVTLEDGRIIRPEDVVELRRRQPLTIVYTGDTAPCENVVEISKDADVLIHEATFSGDEKPEDVWSQGHSRTIDAANIAARANVKMLILTHISARYEGLEDKLLEEARRYFKNTYIAYDLQKFYIEPY